MRARKSTILIFGFMILFVVSAMYTPAMTDKMATNPVKPAQQDQGVQPNLDMELQQQTTLSNIPSYTSGAGYLLDVKEYANGTFPGRTAYANNTSTFYPQTYDIPAGWYTTGITAISSQMYHTTDWVNDGDFPSTYYYYWTNEANDPQGVLSASYDSINDWVSITRASGGKVQYDYWGSWNQTVHVTEGGAASATLNVTFKIDTSTGTNGQNAEPYLYVNGTIWELPTGGQRFSSSQGWTTYSLPLPLTDYSFPGNLTIALGIQGWAGTQFQTTGVLTCDNVSLTLETSRLAEVVNLRARDASQTLNQATFVTGTGGKGYATLNGNWSNSVTLEFLSDEMNTEFNLELFMNLERNNHLDTNTYTVANGSEAIWNAEFTAREMAYPFTYYYFNISIPHDWTMSEVRDAYNDLQLQLTTYYNATFYSTEGVLFCNVYGTGVSGTPHYGTWTISATAHNYGDAITFEEYILGSWSPQSNYYPGSFLRVGVSFRDGFSNPPESPGSGSLYFYDTEQQLIYTEAGGALDVSGDAYYDNSTNGNITIQPQWLAGPVTALAVWTNGTAVGEIRSNFYLYHHTELEIESAEYQAFRGDTVSVRVKYIDSETGLGISGGTLYFNWTYGSGAMGYAGNGWYAGYVDTSLAVIGGYVVNVNASKQYYDFAETSGITIEIQEKTTLYSPKDLKTPTTDYEIAWGNSKTIYIAYEDTIAMNPDAMSANPGTPASPDVTKSYTSNNVYTTVSSVGNQISLNITTNINPYNIVVGDLTTLTFKIEGKFSVAVTSGTVYAFNVTSGSWVQIIGSYSPVVDTTLSWKTTRPSDFIDGSGVITARVDASYSSAFSYSVDLFDFIAGRPIDGSAPGVSITSNWPAQTVFGTQDGPSYNSLLKVWQVTLGTTNVVPGDYTVLVQASATGHQEKNLELSITVRAHHTRVSTVPPSETPWGWRTLMNISFSDTDNSSVIVSQSNISAVQVDSPYGSVVLTAPDWTYDSSTGTASLTFWLDTSSWDVGTYSVTITVTSSGTGLSKYFDDGNTAAQILIRPHDIGITANPVGQTPWGWKTNVTVSLTDLDNSSLIVSPDNITQIVVAGQVFTVSDWTYSNGVFSFFVDSTAWPISTSSYVVTVVCSDVPNRYYNDRSGSILVTVKAHGLVVSATTMSSTPWSWMTNVSISLIDADNSTLGVSAANITQITIGGQTYTSLNWVYSSGSFYVIVDSSTWSIGTTSLQVSVATASAPAKYYSNGISTVTIQIRSHHLSISVTRPAATPWSWKTTVDISISDLDNESLTVSEANITQILVAGQTFTSSEWTYISGTFTVVVDTSMWTIGTGTYAVSVTTIVGPKLYADGAASVKIQIRSHLLSLTVTSPPGTAWSWMTNVSFSVLDVDNASLTISEANFTQISIAGQLFTSLNWIYSAGQFTCTLDTSAWGIGSAFYPVVVTTSSAGSKFYSDASSTVPIQIARHTLSVQITRPPATPWSDNTSVTVTIIDVNNASLTISESNISQIVINGQVFTSADWLYAAGVFTVNLSTGTWDLGTYSCAVSTLTAGTGATKYYFDGSGSVTVDIRERYTEAYAPTPDPVPSGDDLIFYAEFRDRDLGGALVNASTILLNGTDLVEGTDFWVTWIGEGYYQITMITTGLPLGQHTVLLTMQEANYEDASTTVRYRIRVTDTAAIASGYRFNLPLATSAVFTIQFTDVDHNIGILADTLVSNTTLSYSNVYQGNGVYQITVQTTDATALGSYPIMFNFTKTGYEDAYAIIVITVETHNSYLSFDDAVVPTAIASNITVNLFYEDISLGTGISNATGEIAVSVFYRYENGTTGWAQKWVKQNTGLGTGHYTILINATQFGGTFVMQFTAYFTWTGVAKYESLNRSFSVELQGTDTDLSVSIAPQAVYYGDFINFTLLFKEAQSSLGIDNSSGSVFAYANVVGQSISTSDFTITVLGGGLYRFLLDSSLFGADGSYTIRTYLNCTPTVSPYYTNQTLSLTVTILYRITLIDLVPPQNTAFDENATFAFSYYDSPTNTPILNSSQLYVAIDNPGLTYWLSYSSGTWTVTVDTSSIGSTGTVYLALNVTWVGAPFYQNQTKQVTLTVTARPTQLSYTPPSPTYFISNATIDFTYLDMIDGDSSSMDGSTLLLSSPGLTLAGNYSVVDNGDGTYSLALNTTAFLEPGTYTIIASIAYSGARFESNAQVQFSLRVLYRAIVAIADPPGNTAYEQTIDVVLHVTDGETAIYVSNITGAVRISLANQNASSPAIQSLQTSWTPGSDTYIIALTNTLAVGTYALYLNVSYDYTSPYYGYKVVKVTLSIRMHSTELQLVEPSSRTGFGLNATFLLSYVDLDTSLVISGATVQIMNASLSGYWSIVQTGENLYQVQVNTSAFSKPGTYLIYLRTQNAGTYPNYQDASIYVRVYVRERYTSLTYDSIGSVGYTDNVVITVYYTDSDLANAPITNSTGTVFLSINQSIYSVAEGAAPGSYVITMPANQFVAFASTAALIELNYTGAPYYQNHTITVSFQIRGTSTEFAWEPSDPVPYGNLANVTFYWGDIDSGNPVACTLGVDTEITVVSVTQPGLDTTNITIMNIVQGQNVGGYATFFLLLNTSYLDTCATYSFSITINWINPSQAPYYQDQTNKLITLTVRMRNTAVPQILADPVSYGENATIRLEYVDLDNASALITGSNLSITVLDGLTYEVDPVPVGGFYEVHIITDGSGLLGTVKINMSIQWFGAPFYKNQTSITALLTINLKIATMEITYPDVTPYLDNVVFYITLQDSVTGEYINNNASFISATFISPSIGDTPTISYIAASNGRYEISFNTTILGQVSGYTLNLVFDHSGLSPYYSYLSRNVAGSVRQRVTSLDYDAVAATPYGNYSLFNVTYTDVEGQYPSPIASGSIFLSCSTSGEVLIENTNYWISYMGNGTYQITLDTTALGAPATYSVHVIANSSIWYLAESSRNINIKISFRNVGISLSSPDSTYYGETTFFIVTVLDLDNGTDGTGLQAMTSNLVFSFVVPTGILASSLNIADIGNGQYNVSFDTGILNVLTSYTIAVSFNAPDYWADAGPQSVTGRVQARPSQLSYDIAGAAPYLDNATVSFMYEDTLTSTGIAGGSIELLCATSHDPLILNSNYWIVDEGNGQYTALIDSAALGDVTTFAITAKMTYLGQPFFQNRTQILQVEVRERATRLTYTPPQETPFGDNLTVVLKYYDVDAGLAAIANSQGFFSLDEINGSAVDSSYYWVQYISGATYYLYVNTTKLAIYGRYNLTVSVAGNPAYNYQDQSITLDADVRARNTQLTVSPIAQTSYTDNVTVVLRYTDIDAGVGIYNDTVLGGVSVGLNRSVDWWISQTSPGVYRVLINATSLGAIGDYAFEVSFSWINGKPFYKNQTLDFVVSITGASSVLSYDPPDQVPIGDDIVIVVYYKDSSTGIGIANNTYVHASITPMNSTPAGPFQCTITNPLDGKIVFTINSTPFWTTGPLYFDIDVVWTGGLPFYPSINNTVVRAVIRGIFTQTLADAPDPGTVPLGDSTNVIIAFYDLDHDTNVLGASITTTWAYGWSYVSLGDGRFNITVSTAGMSLLGKVSIQFTFNKMFYLTKTATVYITTRLLATSAIASSPDPSIVPVGDPVSLSLVFFDTDHSLNISGASITTNWIYGWTWSEVPGVGYSITLYTASVTNMVNYVVTFTASKNGYTSASTSVKFEVRRIQTAISAEFTGTVVAGSNISVIVTYEDLDHSTGITGATIYTTAPGGSYTVVEIGGGQYNITYLLWQQPAGTYSYDITAALSKHASASLTVDLVLRQVRTELIIDNSLVQLNWSDSLNLAAYYNNLDLGGLVPNADVRANISGHEYVMSQGSSDYSASIDTSVFAAGTYIVTITANKTNYEARIVQLTVVISVLQTDFSSLGNIYSFTVVSGQAVNVTVYYESLAFGPVTGATATYSWNPGGALRNGTLSPTTQAGYYSAIIDTADVDLNTYTLYVRANKPNHVEASIYFSLNIGLVKTDLAPVGDATIRAVYGETVVLQVNYTNVDLGLPVLGASMVFRFSDANYNGTLTEESNGIYNVTLDTKGLYAGTFSMYVVATKPGYETATLSLLFEVQRIDATAQPLNATLSITYEQSAVMYFTYYDVHNNLPIENATLQYVWQGGTGTMNEVGNGTYSVTLDSTSVIPSSYDIRVTASKANYVTRTTSATLQINPINMQIIVNSIIEVPVGDSVIVSIYINDTSYNRPVQGADGSVLWSLGANLVEDTDHPGNYTFEIPNTAVLGSYDATVVVNKEFYRRVSTVITIVIRPIHTQLTPVSGSNYMSAVVGQYLQIAVEYQDLDHNRPISGADISVSEATGVLGADDFTVSPGTTDGQYIISFTVPVDHEFEITIHASSGQDYEQQNLAFTIVSTAPPQDPLMTVMVFGGSFAIIIALIGALLWVKVYSVPKLIRIMNGMIKSVSKAKVPEKPEVPERNRLLQGMINENLAPMKISKPLAEIPSETIELMIPETEALLMELAEITNLGEEDIQAFRVDLARMKPSERPGFLNEVIKQEKARRAEEIAKKTPGKADAARKVTPEELQEVGERLQKLGLPEDQIEEVLESAKDMTRAELDAVLEQMDKSMEE